MDRDAELVERARAGDETAFIDLVERYHARMLRLACSMLPSRAVAEETVQDTWMGVVRGLDRFEGRSSVRTWLFRILVNRARSAGAREPRSEPLGDDHAGGLERFSDDGAWLHPVLRWTDDSDDRLDAAACGPLLQKALDELPPRQRQVVLLRDAEGLPGEQVAAILGISAGNQRILLHRARSRLRAILDDNMDRN